MLYNETFSGTNGILVGVSFSFLFAKLCAKNHMSLTSIQRIAIFLSDGESNVHPELTIPAAEELRAIGVEVRPGSGKVTGSGKIAGSGKITRCTDRS